MNIKIACLVCSLLLAILILPALAQENKTAPANQMVVGNNTTGNNTSLVNKTTLVSPVALANETIQANNSALVNVSPITENNTAPLNNTPTTNSTSKVNQTVTEPAIHVGLTSAKGLDSVGLQPKAINNVDMYGNKSTYNISAYSNIKPAYNVNASYIKPMQTVTNVVKPLVNVENSTQVRPYYSSGYSAPQQVIDLSSYNESKPVVNLEGYSRVKVPSSVA